MFCLLFFGLFYFILFCYTVDMGYIRKFRRYHTEANLIAQPSDDEDVSNNRHQMFTQNRHPTPENVSDAESNFSDHSNENNPEFESENDV